MSISQWQILGPPRVSVDYSTVIWKWCIFFLLYSAVKAEPRSLCSLLTPGAWCAVLCKGAQIPTHSSHLVLAGARDFSPQYFVQFSWVSGLHSPMP